MSNTIRHRIMERLLDNFQKISKVRGYNYDYEYIDEWRLTGLSSSEKPAIIIRDDNQDVLSYDTYKTDWILGITISVFVQGEESPSDLRNYVADVYKCIGDDVQMDGLILDCKPAGDVIALTQEDDVYGDIDVKFDIHYSTKSWDLTSLI